MNKMKMQTADITSENVEKIGKLFPNCVIEKRKENGALVKAIDFDMLKQELSDFVVDGDIERFQFNWPGKKESILKANTQINGTLRPEVDKSLNFETTQNLYIEGDNLEVLKLLRETYLNRIKVIYIDPPYNTGKDSFLYDDDRHLSMKDYIEKSKVKDDKGNLLFDISVNNESNGQFHSDWLSMMYPRLKLAHSMLTEDGFMFISIDECECYAMKRICNEIFGQANCMGEFIWENRTTPNDADNMFAMTHEYILIYAKDISQVSFIGEKKDFSNYTNPDNDPNGEWIKDNPSAASGSAKDRFAIKNPYTGEEYFPPKGRYWGFSQKRVEEWTKSGKLVFPKELGKNFILKKYKTELKSDFRPMNSIIRGILTMHGTKEMKELFPEDSRVFKYPKPTELIKHFLQQIPSNDYICLDFFSGSASTAHAVMKLNSYDGGTRKFIMVQIPEKPNDEEVIAMGYDTICDVAEERIRRAAKKIGEQNEMLKNTRVIESKEQLNVLEALKDNQEAALDFLKTQPTSDQRMNLDLGFRVLKLDSSNMKDVYYNPKLYNQDLLTKLEENIKEDRTAEDLLFQVMLEMGVLLSSEIKELTIEGKRVFNVNDGNLICCFDKNITEEAVIQIAKMKPLYAVFRDSSMLNDSMSVNFDQIFATYSASTERRVI